MSRSLSKTQPMPATALGVLAVVALGVWGVWKSRQKRRRARLSTIESLLLRGASGKVLDLRNEDSFDEERIRGSHNIPLDSLWEDNRWYELPEQHEALLVLLPPEPEEIHASLAKEIKDRRALGATTTLVASRGLFSMAKENELSEEGPRAQGEASSSTTLFTPSPFLTRAAASLEPHLKQAWVPLTCIDIGCGAGRDAVWLARRGWTVTAVDCWNQALQKTAQLAKRMDVAESVEVVRGKVKHTGEIHLSSETQVNQAYSSGQDGGVDDDEGAGRASEWIIRPSTPPSEFGAYGLVVAIRFLERSAFDTLARLVDPRGGYLLLSTFIEEEREMLAARDGSAKPPLPRTGRSTIAGRGLNGGINRPKRSAARDSVASGNGSVSFGNGLSGGDGPRISESRAGGSGASANVGSTRAGNDTFCVGGAAAASAQRNSARRDPKRAGGGNGSGVTGEKTKRRISPAAALEAAAAAATMARWPHDNPKDPKKILRRGELARVFGDRHGFEVLEDSVERLPDGRPVACFLARRLPLVVSSPSNASNSSSAASPWRGETQLLRDRLSTSPGTPYPSSQQYPNSPVTPRYKSRSPAKGFETISTALLGPTGAEYISPAKGSWVSKPVFVGPTEDGEDASGDGSGGGGEDGRAALLAGFSGAGSGSVRDFTAIRAASSRRRLGKDWEPSSNDGDRELREGKAKLAKG